jgi:hypothetical protein
VNPAAMLGSNMYAGARAQSTFLTRHPSRKVSASPHHEQKGFPFSEQKRREESVKAQTDVTLFIFVCAAMGGGDYYGGIRSTRKSCNKSHLRCSARVNVSE